MAVFEDPSEFVYRDLYPTAVFSELSELNNDSGPIATLNSPYSLL